MGGAYEMLKIVYIDDNIDNGLSEWLDEFTKDAQCVFEGTDYKFEEIDYKSVVFCHNDSFESLVQADDVKYANIILIDSRLFEDADHPREMFTGEDFKLQFQKINPYCEVFVVTQNEIEIQNFNSVRKYSKSGSLEEMKRYYSKELFGGIKEACRKVCANKKAFEKFRNKRYPDEAIVDILGGMLNGNFEYTQAKKEDIDKLIEKFCEVEELLKERENE